MNKRLILMLLAICAASTAASAQTRQVTSREIYSAENAARKLMSERSYRTVTKTDDVENGTIVKSVTKIYERLLPDRTRFLMTEKIGDKETSREIITIDYMQYSRTNNEPWTAKDLRGNGSGSGIAGGSSACIQYTEEATFADGTPARKLRRLTIVNTRDGLSFDDEASWFDQTSGLLLKSEETKGLLDPRVEQTRSVTTYEYDPNIKIEAPIKDAPAVAKP